MQSYTFTILAFDPYPTTSLVMFVFSTNTAFPGETRQRVILPRFCPLNEQVEPCEEGVGIESASYGQAA
jgi:hypothetical protein